jgi:hypothetical protein
MEKWKAYKDQLSVTKIITLLKIPFKPANPIVA